MPVNGYISFWYHFCHAIDPHSVQSLKIYIIFKISIYSLPKIQFDQFFRKVRFNAHHIHPFQIGIAQKAVCLVD